MTNQRQTSFQAASATNPNRRTEKHTTNRLEPRTTNELRTANVSHGYPLMLLLLPRPEFVCSPLYSTVNAINLSSKIKLRTAVASAEVSTLLPEPRAFFSSASHSLSNKTKDTDTRKYTNISLYISSRL